MSTMNLSDTSMRSNNSSFLSRLKLRLVEWRNRAVSRLELASLDDHELRDMGMTRSSAEFEANKPFWRE